MAHHIAIFASGTGSNAHNITTYFQGSETVRVALVVSNKKDAGVLRMAQEHGVPTHIVDRRSFYDTTGILEVLQQHRIDFIALAGFLWLVPGYLIRAFPRRIVNIHPALLPRFGGKGMYGMHVHEAVRAAGERESGMTIHYVDEHYDEGDMVFQASCPVEPGDSASDIARHVLALEHRHYPEVLARLLEALPEAR